MALLDDLLATSDDRTLSRSERRVLLERIAESGLDDDDRDRLRDAAFHAVKSRLRNPADEDLVEWLADVVRVLAPPREPVAYPPSRAWFGPEDPMVETLTELVNQTRSDIDLAVFTLTDDRLAQALMRAHDRGVRVRILSDDDKAFDKGSDIYDLRAYGVPVAMDRSPHHFHHKFAIIDGRALVNGSYNWTRGADRHNRENFLLTYEPALVVQYVHAFEEMWADLAGSPPSG